MFTSLLNRTATVKRKTLTQNADGSVSETFTVVASYPTRYAPKKDPAVSDGSYKTTDTEYLFFFEIGVDVILPDVIEVGLTQYLVRGIKEYDDDIVAHHIEVSANLIQIS